MIEKLNFIIYLQLKAELDRICAKKVSVDAKNKWLEIVPKVLKIAESENNSTIDCLLGHVKGSSIGKFSILMQRNMFELHSLL